MTHRTRSTVLLGVPTLALALTGCHAKASTNAGAGHRPSSAVGASPRTCPAGDTAATINRRTKCLRAGPGCSAKAVSQYPAYGFRCEQQGGRYVLCRKG